MALRSKIYDDIYFSPDDGVAESDYVYIKGNHLPDRFRAIGHRPFVIGELGFGAGLNFLLSVRAFLENAPAHAQLQYYSVEKHPLAIADIDDALAPLQVADLRKQLLKVLRASSWTLPGFHTIFYNDRVRLTLLTGEAEEMLGSLAGGTVDAWFADGFSPAKNPAMWTDGVFTHVGRLSRSGTTISTFSSAGAVRRSMEQIGFRVEKVPGFGSKREMVVGRFTDRSGSRDADHDSRHEIGDESPGEAGNDSPSEAADGSPHSATQSMSDLEKVPHAIVIGGGLAGLTTSLALLRRGWSVELREKLGATGSASSGNPAGLFMPYLTAQPTTISRFTLRACETLASSFPVFGSGDLLHRTGIVRRIGAEADGNTNIDTELEERIEKARQAHGLPASFMRRVDRKSYLMRKAGWTEPAALCKSITDLLLSHGDRFRLTLNERCEHIFGSGDCADAFVVASGTGLAGFKETAFLPVKAVRGQLFVCEAEKAERYLGKAVKRSMRRPAVFENYVIPDPKGWVFGATFEPYSENPERDPASDERLLAQIAEQFPEIGVPMKEDSFKPAHGRVGFRSQAKDYVPVIGPLPDYEKALSLLKSDMAASVPVHDRVFVQGGFGSRGVMSSMLAAEILAAHINQEMYPVESDLVEELLPHRFVRRDARSQK